MNTPFKKLDIVQGSDVKDVKPSHNTISFTFTTSNNVLDHTLHIGHKEKTITRNDIAYYMKRSVTPETLEDVFHKFAFTDEAIDIEMSEYDNSEVEQTPLEVLHEKYMNHFGKEALFADLESFKELVVHVAST